MPDISPSARDRGTRSLMEYSPAHASPRPRGTESSGVAGPVTYGRDPFVGPLASETHGTPGRFRAQVMGAQNPIVSQ